jgi:hypothetical protein
MDELQLVLFANFDSGNMARYERVYKTNVNQNATSNNNNINNNTSNQNGTSSINTNTNNNNSNNNLNNANNNKTSVPSNLNADNTDNNAVPNLNFQQKFDIEFNVWTKPDCEGTPVGPNGNRTWFYFGIRGGHGKWIKFNLMNLNKQGRLFEMGMLPVFKTIPGHEKWARIYSKPTWQVCILLVYFF